MDWQAKLNKFISDFEHMNDTIGILVCGSYVTGGITKHSDLDVHIILSNAVTYRERGNKIIDGLLIEYFANPPHQILQYFNEDFADKTLMSQVQFATGEILIDKTGDVAKLKERANSMIAEFYKQDVPGVLHELSKYFLWDALDDLQDAYETNRADFDLMYFTSLDKLLITYMRVINRPYVSKVILGNIVDATLRNKYLLRELPDQNIANLITKAITATKKDEKLLAFQRLTSAILDNFGSFCIDGFKFKSATASEATHDF